MTEWIFGAPPLSYYTPWWEIALALAGALFVRNSWSARAAFVFFGALTCYGIYLLALWVTFQVPLCDFPDRSGGAGTILAKTRDWYMCGVQRAAFIAAALSIPSLLGLAYLLRRKA